MKKLAGFHVVLAVALVLSACSESKSPEDLHKKATQKNQEKQQENKEPTQAKVGQKAIQISAANAEKFALLKKPTNVRDKVVRIISQQLGVQVRDIKPDSSLVDDLGADEEANREMVRILEDEFKVIISAQEAQELTTAKAIIDYIENKK